MTYKGWILSLVCLYSLSVIVCGEITDELAEAQRFLDNYDAAAEAVYYKSSINWWNYNTNISDHNLQIAVSFLPFIVYELYYNIFEFLSDILSIIF